jgi:hypothetical protein
MKWTELLKSEIEASYATTEKLLDRVDPASLQSKPTRGSDWMTVGHLLMDVSNCCGAACKGFVTGDWGLPEGMKIEDLPPEEKMPPAEKLPTVESVEQAKKLLGLTKALRSR